MRVSMKLAVGLYSIWTVFAASVFGADWPQWRGPNRDGVCRETGLLKEWPKNGPKPLWEISGLGPVHLGTD